MANIGIILGKSGTGKSVGIRTLNPEETIVINVLGKKLPFRNSNTMYKEGENLFNLSSYIDIISLIDEISKTPKIKNLVIDDSIYIMMKEYLMRARENGYNKFVELGQHFQQVLASAEAARADLNIFFILHMEDVVNDKTIVGGKVRTVGKLVDDYYSPIEVVPIVLVSDVKFDDKGAPSFGYYTHRSIKNGVEIPAKTPDEMFTEDWIPNDLGAVVKAMEEYYG